jgi:replicative DNA helicase Mcm
MEILEEKEIISRFFSFIDELKKKDIEKVISYGKDSMELSFFELSSFDPEISEILLEKPEYTINIFEETLKQFYDIKKRKKKIRIRISDLPSTEKFMIREIRSSHIGKLILVEGIVRRKTDVRPRLKEIHYLCINPDCSYSKERLKIEQKEEKAKILKACPKCRSPVEIMDKILIDSQSLVLEEIPESLENSADQPKRVNILLQDDLVSPFKESKTNPGSKVYVIGFVKEIPLSTRTGAESVNYDIIVQGNYIGFLEEDYSEISISKEEEKEIKKIAKSENPVELLVSNIAPSIFGNEKIKEAILLQLFGGSKKIKGDGIKMRGDIHILLLGDPGAAKSQLLKAASKIAPKGSFVSGKSASAAGLTASVIKDDLMKGWALEAGAMVLASGGLCAIDELDKMSDEDTSAMHEALEQQSISIAKANIRASLKCETTVLAAANPKFGRFDPYGDIYKQIDFPPALVSRFDLIFILKDTPNKKKDEMIAEHILMSTIDKKKTIANLSSDFIKKYIAYAKEKVNPVMTIDAKNIIQEFYVSMRNAVSDEEESGAKSIPITARQLEAIIRLSEAYAKIELSNIIEKKHAQRAIDMIMYCLKKIGIDPKTGELDIDRITTGVTTSTRNLYKQINLIIDKLEGETPEIKTEDIYKLALEKGIEKSDVDTVISKLKEEGQIFEPRKGIIKKI